MVTVSAKRTMVIMASGMVRRRLRPTYDDVAQHGGHTKVALGMPPWLHHWTSVLWSIDSVKIKVSADQYHITISAQV